MKRFKLLIISILFLFLFSMSGIANAITLTERDELNNATPGTSKVGLGTLLRSTQAVGSVTLLTGDTASSADNQTINLAVEPSGDTGYVRKFSGVLNDGGDYSLLGNGSVGQTLTIALVNDGGADYTVTPDTSSGFSTITFDDAGDNATLHFKNSTLGWVIFGSGGTTITGPIAPFN